MKLRSAAWATLTAAEQTASKRIRWADRLTSPWAPVTVLGLVFLVYLTIVESSVCTYHALQPGMKALGVFCFWWWAVVLIAGWVLRGWAAHKRERTALEESIAELEKLADKHRARLSADELAEVVTGRAAAEKALAQGVEAVKAGTIAVDALITRRLAKFRRASALDFADGFVKALAVALLVRAVLLEPFKIPSGSMLPTLEIGDQIFVNKFIYGVRLPFTNFVPFVIWRAPKRGDVIVFENPNQPNRDFIKRVVGVPGDKLRMNGRQVTLNGEPLAQKDVAAEFTTWERPADELVPWLTNPRQWLHDDWWRAPVALTQETLDGVPHWTAHSPVYSKGYGEEIVVPEGAVFVMGDNRDNSSDSRFGFLPSGGSLTFVPYGHIKGKATAIWFALGHGGLLSSTFGGTGIRTDRFFQPVTLCGDEAQPSDGTK